MLSKGEAAEFVPGTNSQRHFPNLVVGGNGQDRPETVAVIVGGPVRQLKLAAENNSNAVNSFYPLLYKVAI